MKNKYDVIIIGSGIGGLVCGCYLAKSGKNVLIIEKHSKPGGYCTSFSRKGFTFDVAVHYIGSGRSDGQLGRLVRDLELNKYLEFKRLDPSDRIITPSQEIFIRKDPKLTIAEFIKTFPSQKSEIESFFNFILGENFFKIYSEYRGKTFDEVLGKYFKDEQIKSILEILLGNIGLSSHSASAVTAITLFRDFILDGGYYPMGGSQAFPDALSRCFKSWGGDIIFSKEVSSIITKNNKIAGAVIEDGKVLECKFVVSNVDAKKTFEELVDKKNSEFLDNLKKLNPSSSAFGVYLGLNINLRKSLKGNCGIWKFSTYDVKSCYSQDEEFLKNRLSQYLLCLFPSNHDPKLAPKDKSIVEFFVFSPYRDKKFWIENKDVISKNIIEKGKEVIPGLDRYIEVMEIATPVTFEKYTHNFRGATYGWASTPDQIDVNIVPQKTYIENLFLAGHWSTGGLGQGGVVSVIYSGRSAANKILRRKD